MGPIFVGEVFIDTKNNVMNKLLFQNITLCNKVDQIPKPISRFSYFCGQKKKSEYLCNIVESGANRKKRRFSTRWQDNQSEYLNNALFIKKKSDHQLFSKIKRKSKVSVQFIFSKKQ
jgi:hypothetical protein